MMRGGVRRERGEVDEGRHGREVKSAVRESGGMRTMTGAAWRRVRGRSREVRFCVKAAHGVCRGSAVRESAE